MERETYAPHHSPVPNLHVLWMSAISLSRLTFRAFRSGPRMSVCFARATVALNDRTAGVKDAGRDAVTRHALFIRGANMVVFDAWRG